MYILRANNSVEAERELVATMLNFEAGKRIYNKDLQCLQPPHEVWPILKIPPVTDQGSSVKTHYHPTVGFIYYTGFDYPTNADDPAGRSPICATIHRILGLLDQIGYTHFPKTQISMATPASVHRTKLPIEPHTFYEEVQIDRFISKLSKSWKKKRKLDARLITLLLGDSVYLEKSPPHYSTRAHFTWIVLPVASAFALESIKYMSDMNAVTASILFNASSCHILAPEVEIYRPLQLRDFSATSKIKITEFCSLTNPLFNPSTLNLLKEGYIILRRDGSVEFSHQCPRISVAPNFRESSLALDSKCKKLIYPYPYSHQCVYCCTPLGERAILLSGIRKPKSSWHTEEDNVASFNNFDNFTYIPPLEDFPVEERSVLLCEYCWSWIDSPHCLSSHMSTSLEYIIMSHKQSEICKQIPMYEFLAPFLMGSQCRIEQVPGAFIYKVNDIKCILTGTILGICPQLMIPYLAKYNLPIISGLKIIEILD